MDILALFRDHVNAVDTKSSGPVLRQLQPITGEVTETFNMQKSWETIRDKMEMIEMIEANLQAEIGTGGKPRTRPKPMKQIKLDYT